MCKFYIYKLFIYINWAINYCKEAVYNIRY